MPQSPNNYNPLNTLISQKNEEISYLTFDESHGKISEEEMKTAQAFRIEDSLFPKINELHHIILNMMLS